MFSYLQIFQTSFTLPVKLNLYWRKWQEMKELSVKNGHLLRRAEEHHRGVLLQKTVQSWKTYASTCLKKRVREAAGNITVHKLFIIYAIFLQERNLSVNFNLFLHTIFFYFRALCVRFFLWISVGVFFAYSRVNNFVKTFIGYFFRST